MLVGMMTGMATGGGSATGVVTVGGMPAETGEWFINLGASEGSLGAEGLRLRSRAARACCQALNCCTFATCNLSRSCSSGLSIALPPELKATPGFAGEVQLLV